MNNPGTRAYHLDGVRILDLFAGPGGLDVAAHFLGFKSIGIEWDRTRARHASRQGCRRFTPM